MSEVSDNKNRFMRSAKRAREKAAERAALQVATSRELEVFCAECDRKMAAEK